MIKRLNKKKKTYKKLIVKKTYFFQHLCNLHHCTYKYTIHVTIVCVMSLSEPEPSSLYTHTLPVKLLLILIQFKETV